MHSDYRPQVLHVVHHADEHLMRFLGKLLQKFSGLSQKDVDAMTQKMKEANDSLEAKLPPSGPAS